MIHFISKIFIRDYQNYNDIHVRQKYGTLCSILSIICNLILVVFKISIGMVSHSVAIQADGLNNLSDVGSNVASLFGFKLANKHPDEEHPYGHGRYEYIAGLVIAFLIIMVGFQSLREAIMKIIEPDHVVFSLLAVLILIFSILIKLWMYSFNRYIGNQIDSSTLKAAGQDSLNDVLTTSATLFSLLLTLVTDLPVDGIFGAVVSLFVLKAGIDVFKDTVNPLLGLAPDHDMIAEIEKFIMSFDKPLGIHDLMMHDYGPGRMFMTLHVEVDKDDDIMAIHDEIDLIERAIHSQYHILTTIHMDPIDLHNKELARLKELTRKIVEDINPNYSIHDFRMVTGTTHTNLIFDVLVPSDDEIDHHLLKREISKRVQDMNSHYYTVIHIDHSYV